jgi:hypothetical protein
VNPEGFPVPPIRSYRLSFLLLLSVLWLTFFWPSTASAQRAVVRPAPGPAHGPTVVVHAGFGYGYGYPFYPFYPYYNPWFGWGPYPYPYWGYGYPVVDALTGSIKLEVTPKTAEVFVDGYRAGVVDNFDGVFQRLRVQPGAHEITLFSEGYRTIRQSLYLGVGSDQKVHYAMEKLGPGEVSEPPPAPATDSPDDDPTKQPPAPAPGPRRTAPPAEPSQPGEPAGPPPAGNQARRFGTLSIRVQPTDAEVLIDGERWNAPGGQDRISVELAAGRHHVEIRKAGFNQYSEDVLILQGATLPLNVSLLRGTGN